MGATMHITPIGDLIEHETDGESSCVCGPKTLPVEVGEGPIAWAYVHASLDGRESAEGA